jgi:hypothetical protein
MPITLPNGSNYKLCLLDTNALSEIVKRPSNEGRGYIERFPPHEFVPCFTVYNLFELRRQSDVFRKFVKFFGVYPSFITQPFQFILNAEVEAKGRAKVNDILLNPFTPLGSDSSYHLAEFIKELFKMAKMAKLESGWRKSHQEVLDAWQASKANFSPTKSVPNALDAKRFVHDASIDYLCQIRPDLVQASLNTNNVSLLQSFPSMQMMLYSQYYRIFDPTWKPLDQEVADVCISACAPYVDAVVTEKFQAEIYKKVYKHISGMSATIAKLNDIRHHT